MATLAHNFVSIPPETLFESFVRYGLYIGAGFQLVCLAACILLPGSSNSTQGDDHDSDSEGSLQNTPKKPAPTATTHHRRKDNKKKRR